MGEQDKLYEKIIRSIEEANKSQTRELKTYINSEINELKETIQREQTERKELEIKYEELKNRYAILERKLRKNNIIVFGIESNTENLLKYTVDKINNHLELNILPRDINNIFTIGKSDNKPIIIQFVSFLTKIEVLKNRQKLKGTNISISEELSVEEREKNKILRKHLTEARAKNLSAYIKNGKLYVSGIEYTEEQLEDNYIEEYNEQQQITTSKSATLQLQPLPPKETSLIRKRSEEQKEHNTNNIEYPRQENKKKKTTLVDFNIARSSARLAEKESITARSSPKPTMNIVDATN